jgi:probable HAF family extracellular repeat protein
MRSRLWFRISVAMVVSLTIPASIVAQASGPKRAHYRVTDLGTLGGTYSTSYTINDAGVVGGGAATAAQIDGISQTAFLWYRGQIVNMGTLGGSACPDCSSESAGSDAGGVAALLSETASTDPNGEDFCGFGTHLQCRAGIWKNGSLTALPLLGSGNNSQAYWTNNSGVTAGFSETGIYDGNCAMASQSYRFEGVKWGLDGAPHPLRPLESDTVSFALGINDRGQAVGVSGLCSNTTFPPNSVPSGPHAVMWEKDGTPVLVDSLPGAVGTNNVGSSINNRGDVAGTQEINDGTVHGFLWNKGSGIQDLALPGAFVTVVPCCHAVNDRREITGFAFDANGPQTFIWKDGAFTDLNTVLPVGTPWYVFNTASINNAGQIAATGLNTSTGEAHALLLTPILPTGAPIARGATKTPDLPPALKASLKKQLPSGKFGK